MSLLRIHRKALEHDNILYVHKVGIILYAILCNRGLIDPKGEEGMNYAIDRGVNSVSIMFVKSNSQIVCIKSQVMLSIKV